MNALEVGILIIVACTALVIAIGCLPENTAKNENDELILYFQSLTCSLGRSAADPDSKQPRDKQARAPSPPRSKRLD
jgi:hypothetical protein